MGTVPNWLPAEAVPVLEDLLRCFPHAVGCCAHLPARRAAVFVLPGQPVGIRLATDVPVAGAASRLRALSPERIQVATSPAVGDSAAPARLLLGLPGASRCGPLERAVLRSKAEQLVACLEAGRLRDEVVRLRRSLGAAVQIHRLLSNGLEMENLLGAGLEPITQMVGASGAGILLYHEPTGELVLQRPAFNIDDGSLIDQYRVRVEPQHEPITTAVYVFLTGQPYVNNEPLNNTRVNQHFIRLFGVRNSVTLPLIVDNQPIGVLHVINKRSGPFTDDDVQLLTLVASQLAVLLDNARLMLRLQRREQEAKLLYDIGTEISGSLELDQILASVAEKSRYLVQAELASISLLDPDTEHASVRVAAGDHNGVIRQVHFSPNAGTTARVVRERRPVSRHLPAAVGDLDNLDMVARSGGFSTVLAVPLIAGGQVFGLLHAWRRSREAFTAEETELLSRLSVQAAIAVDKARQYQTQQHALAELRRLHGLIQAQHQLLKQAHAVHRDMTALVLEGKGHQAIADTLSRLIQGPVAVLDRYQRPLALAGPGSVVTDPCWQRLQAQVQGGPRLADARAGEKVDRHLAQALQIMAEQMKPLLLPPDPDCGRAQPRLMAPVVVEHEVLGYISVLQNGRPFADGDYVAAEQAATVCALVMLKEKTAIEVEYRLKGDLLFELCRGRYKSEEDFMHRAAVLGYDLQQPHAVLLLEADADGRDARPGTNPLSLVRRLVDLARSLLQEYAPRALVAAQGENVLILAPDGDCSPQVLAERLRARLTKLLGQSVSVGVGSTCQSLTAYPRSYREARQALAIARRQGLQGRVSAFADLGIHQVLFQVPDTSALHDFVQRTLGPLLAYDRQHGTPLAYTLDQFLKHHGNRQATCKALFVHINTLNYRLRRISEILGLMLDDHAARLNLDLALRVLETMDPGQLVGPSK